MGVVGVGASRAHAYRMSLTAGAHHSGRGHGAGHGGIEPWIHGSLGWHSSMVRMRVRMVRVMWRVSMRASRHAGPHGVHAHGWMSVGATATHVWVRGGSPRAVHGHAFRVHHSMGPRHRHAHAIHAGGCGTRHAAMLAGNGRVVRGRGSRFHSRWSGAWGSPSTHVLHPLFFHEVLLLDLEPLTLRMELAHKKKKETKGEVWVGRGIKIH